MKYFRIVAPDLAIDLGTANTIVTRLDKGIVVEEPTVVALDFKKLEILAIGREAKELIGKSPENMAAIRPLQDGVISDFDLTQALLEHYIHKAVPGVSIMAPRLTISIPSAATDVENRAIQDACLQAGARDVYLVEEALASAYGAKLIDSRMAGALILNMGAGTTETAVVSAYGVITSQTMKKGGDALDAMIRDFIRERYSLVIGENTAEQLKMTIASLSEKEPSDCMEISGRDLGSGMPRSIDVFTHDIMEPVLPFADQVVDQVRYTLEKTPPELAADIMKKGLYVTGGASQLDGLPRYIEQKIGIRVTKSATPNHDTILGAAEIMKNIDQFKNKRGRA